MHVFPGQNYYKGYQQFWYPAQVEQFLNIVAKYKDDIKLISGAHIHRS